jgi:hypothetical protein
MVMLLCCWYAYLYISAAKETMMDLPNPKEAFIKEDSDVLLYLHVPFCMSKCNYCNFAVDTRSDESLHSSYSYALSQQTSQWVKCIISDKSIFDHLCCFRSILSNIIPPRKFSALILEAEPQLSLMRCN